MQNLFFNSISKLFITAALCVTLLSACGGGGGSTTVPLTAEQQAYNAALATYNAAVTVADYNAAIAKFEAFIPSYPGTRVDDAKFYIARATHELALIGLAPPFPGGMPTLNEARRQYLIVVATDLNKADDAQYQIGRTYYDVAEYPQALIEFDLVLTDFQGSSASDDAQYYIGRTKHEQALLAQIAGSPAATLFNEARTAYNLVISNYTTSIRRDDAQYQIGRTFYDVVTPTALNYSTALGHFQTVINTYGITASVADDAQYYIGRTMHEQALLPTPESTLLAARNEYVKVNATTYPGSIRLDDAEYQVGRTYYDVAIPIAADYSNALGHFQTVISNYGTTASAAGDAQYYIGRTIHQGALLAVLPLPNATYTLAKARTEYLKVNVATYPGSVRLDDAEYQVGRTFYDVAIPTAIDYSTALGHFQAVISNYTTAASAADDAQFYIGRTIHQGALLLVKPLPPATYTLANARLEYGNVATTYLGSIRLDDAAFYSALTFHDANDCPAEKAAMTAFVGTYSDTVSPIFHFDAQGHLDRINGIGGGHSTC